MKAVRITGENKTQLEIQFGLRKGSLELDAGMWLVSTDQFTKHDIVTKQQLEAFYHIIEVFEDGTKVIFPRSANPVLPIFSS